VNADEGIILTWIVLGALFTGLLFFVIRGAKKTKSLADYAVGSVVFSPLAVGLSLAASMTSAATFIINPGFIATYGLSAFISYGLVLPLASVLSLVYLSKRFRAHGDSVQALTLAQWMGTRYQSKGLALFFAFLALLLITFIVLINVGLTKILSKALQLDEIYVLLFIITLVFGYMMFGGANSLVYTNTLQAAIMLLVAIILLGSGWHYFAGGMDNFIARLAAIDSSLIETTNRDSFLFRDFTEIIFVQIIVGIAIVCQPHIITKSLLLKKESDVNRYLMIGVAAQMLFFAVVFAGFYARLSLPDLTYLGQPLKLDGILSAYVVSEFTLFTRLLVIVGLIAAGLSTLEGLIQSVSTTITNDIIRPLSRGRLQGVFVNRLVIVGLAIIAFFLSYQQLLQPKLSVAIFAQNGVYAFFAAAFVPILFGMFGAALSRQIVTLASVGAVIVHFTYHYAKLPIPGTLATGENPGVAAAMAILTSFIIGLSGFIYQRQKNAD
jgi:sodium/pantothenate symporter